MLCKNTVIDIIKRLHSMRHIEVSSDIGDNLTSCIFSDKNNSVFVRQELNIGYNNSVTHI